MVVMVVVIVIARFAVVVGNRTGAKKYQPAKVKRVEVFDRFADNGKYKMRYKRHDQAGCGHKLVGVHLPWIVNFGKLHVRLVSYTYL